MAIRFFSLETDFSLPHKRIINRWIKHTILSHQFKVGDINFIFTTNEKILEVNRQYLSHDYFTDIITFNYNDSRVIAGDIYISIDTVRTNASIYHVTFNDELYRVIIHGILHLVGYNDKSNAEQKEMTNAEDLYLKILYSQFMVS